MANPLVVDLSHHNPTPEWSVLKNNGTIGVIHKATEGTSYVDDTLFQRARPAMDAGLCWSTYHFLRPGNMEAQMDHYLSTLDPVLGERICLDHEDTGVSLADLEACVIYLRRTRPDLQVTIYSGHVIKDQIGNGYSDILAKYTSLWIAQYTTASAPSWPTGTWPAWSLWQFTDSAACAGISAPVDGNKWNGTEEGLIRWFGPIGAEPEPEPEPGEPATVSIITTGRVVITVNGEQIVT